MKRLLGILSFLIALFYATGSFAQSCWPDASGTRADCGSPTMYINGSGQAVPVTPSAPMPVLTTSAVGSGNAGYPAGATPEATTVINTSNGATAATGLTLAGTSGQYTYVCGWSVFTNGGTAQDVDVTIGPLAGSGINYQFSVPAFAATNATKIGDTYQPCLRASSIGSGIGVVVPAQGTGNTNVTVNVWGYTQ